MQYVATQKYYNVDFLYQIDVTISNSLLFFFKTYSLFFTYPVYVFFIFLLVVLLYLNRKEQSLVSMLLLFCLLFSLPIYVILIKKIVIGSHVLVFSIPPLVSACFVFPLNNNVFSKKIFTRTSIVVLIFTSLFMYRSLKNNYWFSSTPPEFKIDEKKLNVTLCKYFDKCKISKPVWQGFFDTYQAIPAVETFYTYGKVILSPSMPLYNVELGYWKQSYPNMNE